MALVWSDDGLKSEKDGRKLEIEHRADDGSYWLKVWLTPSRSKIAGIFASPEVARYAAEHLPADLSQIESPHAAFGTLQ